MAILNSNKYLNLSICADDFGYNSEINKSIIKLIEKKIVTETSCLINQCKYFKEDYISLKNKVDEVNIGLHLLFLNNENYNRLELYKYKKTFLKYLFNSHLNLINKNKVKYLINTQLDLFEKFFKNIPKFIDSHMHIHQFPNISEIFLDTLISRYNSNELKNIYVRNTENLNLKDNNIKSKILSEYGNSFKKKLISSKINTNINFIGSYEFNKSFEIKYFYKKILHNIVDGTLLMTHPGFYNEINKNTDNINNYRKIEYNFLNSIEFKDLLELNKIKINNYNNNLLY